MNSPWAKLYGIWFGLISMAMAACATPDLPANASNELTSITTPTAKRADKDLTKGERVRAIAARGRMLRTARVPTEKLVREFDAMGVLKHEFVWSDTAWVERAGTLPASYRTQALVSFLLSPKEAAAFTGDSVVTGTISGTVYDSITSAYAVATDTLSINYTSGVSIQTRDSDDPNLISQSEVISSSPSGAGNVDAMIAGVVTAATSDGFIEVSLGGADFATSVTLAKGMMPPELYSQATYRANPRSSGGGTAWLLASAAPSPGPVPVASASMMTTVNCNGHLYYLGMWVIVGVIIGLTGMAVLAGIPSTTISAIVWGSVGVSIAGAAFEAIHYALCRAAGASIRGSLEGFSSASNLRPFTFPSPFGPPIVGGSNIMRLL